VGEGEISSVFFSIDFLFLIQTNNTICSFFVSFFSDIISFSPIPILHIGDVKVNEWMSVISILFLYCLKEEGEETSPLTSSSSIHFE
jgi:hypothetical protein